MLSALADKIFEKLGIKSSTTKVGCLLALFIVLRVLGRLTFSNVSVSKIFGLLSLITLVMIVSSVRILLDKKALNAVDKVKSTFKEEVGGAIRDGFEAPNGTKIKFGVSSYDSGCEYNEVDDNINSEYNQVNPSEEGFEIDNTKTIKNEYGNFTIKGNID